MIEFIDNYVIICYYYIAMIESCLVVTHQRGLGGGGGGGGVKGSRSEREAKVKTFSRGWNKPEILPCPRSVPLAISRITQTNISL